MKVSLLIFSLNSHFFIPYRALGGSIKSMLVFIHEFPLTPASLRLLI